MQNTNRSHGFKRDTLVYSLGILTESVIQAALADQELRVHYDCWLLQERRSPSENEEVQKPLIRAGLGCGEVVLLARPQNGQFCIALEHAHFKAVVAATFNVEAGHLCGLSVMRFDGDMVGCGSSLGRYR